MGLASLVESKAEGMVQVVDETRDEGRLLFLISVDLPPLTKNFYLHYKENGVGMSKVLFSTGSLN
jgi:hypothetical protein